MVGISSLPTAVNTHNVLDSDGFVLDRSRFIPDLAGIR